jgi:hypothetical protein
MSEDEGCNCPLVLAVLPANGEVLGCAQTHFLVRVFENRRIEHEEGRQGYLLDEVRTWPAQASRAFQVPASHGRTARSTVVQIAFGTVTVLPPRAREKVRC